MYIHILSVLKCAIRVLLLYCCSIHHTSMKAKNGKHGSGLQPFCFGFMFTAVLALFETKSTNSTSTGPDDAAAVCNTAVL